MAIKNDVGYPSLETERLSLRILNLDDSNAVFEHFSDRDVTRFMDIELCKDLKEAEEIIQFHLDDAGCRWGIYEKVSKSFMGTVGFHYLRNQGGAVKAEVGYDLSKRYWGKGYMVEAMKEVISFGFQQMELDIIDATVDELNQKSIQLLEKLGFVSDEKYKDGNELYFYLERGKA